MNDQKVQKKLMRLGLSQQEADIYIQLTKAKSLTAKDIAKKLDIYPNAVYRVAKKLIDKKFIIQVSKSPKTYSASPTELSIPAFAKEKANKLSKDSQDLISLINLDQGQSPTEIQVIGGKKEMFDESTKLIKNSKNEVLIISIGEPSTNELILANKKASLRGVKIKFIAHKYDEENKDFLNNLKKNGLEIRYFKGKGYHLVIVDRETTLLAVNEPRNTDERVTLKFTSRDLSKALGDYFDSIWEKAIKT